MRSGQTTLARGVRTAAHALPPDPLRRVRPVGFRSALVGALNRALRVHPKTYLVTTRFGFRMSGTTRDLLQRYVFLFGVWEPHISRWAYGHLRRGDVVVDIGANVGWFSMLCATRVGPTGRVIAFEPVPSILELLNRNLALNDLHCVDVQPVAVTDATGDIEVFRAADHNIGLSATRRSSGSESEGRVKAVRAADVIDRELWSRIRLVKVDTEGDELRALCGLAPVLEAMPVGAGVLVEITPDELVNRGDSAEGLVALMRAAGFGDMLALANSYDWRDYAHELPEEPSPLTDPPSDKTDVIFLKVGS